MKTFKTLFKKSSTKKSSINNQQEIVELKSESKEINNCSIENKSEIDENPNISNKKSKSLSKGIKRGFKKMINIGGSTSSKKKTNLKPEQLMRMANEAYYGETESQGSLPNNETIKSKKAKIQEKRSSLQLNKSNIKNIQSNQDLSKRSEFHSEVSIPDQEMVTNKIIHEVNQFILKNLARQLLTVIVSNPE